MNKLVDDIMELTEEYMVKEEQLKNKVDKAITAQKTEKEELWNAIEDIIWQENYRMSLNLLIEKYNIQ